MDPLPTSSIGDQPSKKGRKSKKKKRKDSGVSQEAPKHVVVDAEAATVFNPFPDALQVQDSLVQDLSVEENEEEELLAAQEDYQDDGLLRTSRAALNRIQWYRQANGPETELGFALRRTRGQLYIRAVSKRAEPAIQHLWPEDLVLWVDHHYCAKWAPRQLRNYIVDKTGYVSLTVQSPRGDSNRATTVYQMDERGGQRLGITFTNDTMGRLQIDSVRNQSQQQSTVLQKGDYVQSINQMPCSDMQASTASILISGSTKMVIIQVKKKDDVEVTVRNMKPITSSMATLIHYVLPDFPSHATAREVTDPIQSVDSTEEIALQPTFLSVQVYKPSAEIETGLSFAEWNSSVAVAGIRKNSLFSDTPLELFMTVLSVNQTPCRLENLAQLMEQIDQTVGELTIVAQTKEGNAGCVQSTVPKTSARGNCGIHFTRDASFGARQLFIEAISPNSPFTTSLLNMGDAVMSINCYACDHMTAREAEQIIEDSTSSITIVSKTLPSSAIVLGCVARVPGSALTEVPAVTAFHQRANRPMGPDEQRKRHLISWCVGLAVLVILVIGIKMVTSIEGDSSTTDPPSGTYYPNESANFQRLAEVLSSYIPEIATGDLSENKYSALGWLADLDGYDTTFSSEREIVERYVLAVFFYATTDHEWSWVERYEFLSSRPVCDWFVDFGYTKEGVLCVDGMIRGLVIPSNDLTGSIPPELGLLDTLQDLNLEESWLLEILPSELMRLTQLTSLQLGGTYLNDMIPTEIGQLSRLVNLDLSSTGLHGPLPSEMGELTRLEVLNLQWSWGLSGTVPYQLQKLTKLNFVYLQHTSIQGDLDWPFCMSWPHAVEFSSPCGKSDVFCSCCTMCCFDDGPCEPNDAMPSGPSQDCSLDVFFGTLFVASSEPGCHRISLGPGGSYDHGTESYCSSFEPHALIGDYSYSEGDAMYYEYGSDSDGCRDDRRGKVVLEFDSSLSGVELSANEPSLCYYVTTITTPSCDAVLSVPGIYRYS